MNILFDNVNLKSSSGPNGFAIKLSDELRKQHSKVFTDLDSVNDTIDIQLSFINSRFKLAPIVQRLDGIYFNSEQDFNNLNGPIKSTYRAAEVVIFQSEFNKQLTEHYFGVKEKSFIIHNGTNLEKINDVPALDNAMLNRFDKVWTCASSWRPHKRLAENIRYFMEHSGKNDCLVIAGENPDIKVKNDRILYAGHLNWDELIALFKKSSFFIHLAWLDHCPNVVIDARASGCHIICSSAGGTVEIAGTNSTVIVEDDWDFEPVKLYSPPPMDFLSVASSATDTDLAIGQVTKMYLAAFGAAL